MYQPSKVWTYIADMRERGLPMHRGQHRKTHDKHLRRLSVVVVEDHVCAQNRTRNQPSR